MHFGRWTKAHDRLDECNKGYARSADFSHPIGSASDELGKCGCASHQRDQCKELVNEVQKRGASPMIARRVISPILKLKPAIRPLVGCQPFFGLSGGAWSEVTLVAPPLSRFSKSCGLGWGLWGCPPLFSAMIKSPAVPATYRRGAVTRKLVTACRLTVRSRWCMFENIGLDIVESSVGAATMPSGYPLRSVRSALDQTTTTREMRPYALL